MTLLEYSQLKQCILETSVERYSETLSSLKEFFKDTINSVRRFEQINSIGQLLKVLEIRDLLSEDHVDCLKNIALKLPNSNDVLQKIAECESATLPSNKKEPEDSFFTSRLLGSKKQRIFEKIINVIGRFWRQLAINLKIRECEIHDINIQYATFALKATKVMEKYDVIADPQRWFFVLCDALEIIGRKDVVRSIQLIICE